MSIDLLNGKLQNYRDLTSANEEATSRIARVISSLLEGRSQYAREAFKAYIPVKEKRKKK